MKAGDGLAPLAVCAIFRDEACFLAEWIGFHRLVGVEHFFLYDNGSEDGPAEVLAPFIERGWVTHIPWQIPFHEHAARRAYTDALGRARGRFRWLAAIDLDEFLFAPEHDTLLAVLPEFEQHPGIVVRWQVYGSSGHVRASDAPVIQRFTRRAPTQWVRNRRFKSIVDPDRALQAAGCHHFEFPGGMSAVNEAGAPTEFTPRMRFKKRLRRLYPLLGPALSRVDPYASFGLKDRTVAVEHLRINHYPVKSREEFERKARFKAKKRRYQGLDYFAYHDHNEVDDPILTRYLPALRELLRETTAVNS